MFVGSTGALAGVTGAVFGATDFDSFLSFTAGLAVGVGADTFGSGGVARLETGVFVD